MSSPEKYHLKITIIIIITNGMKIDEAACMKTHIDMMDALDMSEASFLID